MATNVITDEAELRSLADLLGKKIEAFFLSRENFLAYDINIVYFSKRFFEANMDNKPAVTREDFGFYLR